MKRKKWHNRKELKVIDKAPKVIAGRQLGPDDSITQQAQSNDEGEGEIDAKLVEIDDDLAEIFYQACLQDEKDEKNEKNGD